MTLKFFGYILSVHKDKHDLSWINEASRMSGPACKVARFENTLVLVDHEGYIIPYQVDLSLIANLNQPVKATCSFLINGTCENPKRKHEDSGNIG